MKKIDRTIHLLKLINAWIKAETIIESCTKIVHLEIARQYLQLLNILFKDADSYKQLNKLIEEKETRILNDNHANKKTS